MKTLKAHFGLVLGLGLLLAAQPSFAKRKESTPAPTANPHSESHLLSDTETRLGFGMSTYGGSTNSGLFAPALDLWYEIGSLHSLQVLAAIGSSDPFTFSIGAAYRYNIIGDQSAGAHAGLGLNMGLQAGSTTPGASTSYFLNIFPLVGFHFGLGGLASNVVLSFDGGPLFAITPNFQFGLSPTSALMGAAINYFF